MNKQSLSMIWDHLRQMNGINVRLLANLPADKLDSHPIPKMRTPKELMVHLYGSVIQSIAVGVTAGEFTEVDEPAIAASLKTKDDLIRYCNDCWTAADRSISSATEAQLAAMVKTPWNTSMPGSYCVQVIRDELTHHRGQLFCYLRALGQDVPMMWDFEHNAPEFQPKAHAGA
jgi:uncharacterized damage-inducible protein DinB